MKTRAEGRRLHPVKQQTAICGRLIDWIVHQGTAKAFVFNSRHVFVAGVDVGARGRNGFNQTIATAKLYDARDFINEFIKQHGEKLYYEIVSGIWQPKS